MPHRVLITVNGQCTVDVEAHKSHKKNLIDHLAKLI